MLHLPMASVFLEANLTIARSLLRRPAAAQRRMVTIDCNRDATLDRYCPFTIDDSLDRGFNQRSKECRILITVIN